MTIDALPDLEAVASVAIRNAGIAGLIGVYSSIPNTPSFPLITVQRIGGQPAVKEMLDAAIIQVDIWGGVRSDGGIQASKSDIHDIAQEARVALLELEGTTVSSPVGAFITAVEDVGGLLWAPDPSTGRDRYLFSMRLYGRSVPIVSS